MFEFDPLAMTFLGTYFAAAEVAGDQTSPRASVDNWNKQRRDNSLIVICYSLIFHFEQGFGCERILS